MMHSAIYICILFSSALGQTTEINYSSVTLDETTTSLDNNLSSIIDETSMITPTTDQQMVNNETIATTIMTTTDPFLSNETCFCTNEIDEERLDQIKEEIYDRVLQQISLEWKTKFEELEERLSELTSKNLSIVSPVRLDWQIYENLLLPLDGWKRVFDQPYNHKTRTDDLTQLSGLCHNDVLVSATYNDSITLAAVGPANVLSLNTTWNQPKQFGQVFWYRTSGKSFGFSPSMTIRQTTADNEDLNSSTRLSWYLDQNMGGYRVGNIRLIQDNPLWHKVIFCN